jgi:lipoprotein-anchoring transpeptidase ErfK/SrfK
MSQGAKANHRSEAVGLTRRSFLIGMPLTLAACQTVIPTGPNTPYDIYGPVTTEPYPIPAVDLSQVNPAYYRRIVPVPSHIPNNPGEIVVDPFNRYVFLVMPDNMAIQYGCGVGRAGFEWSGHAYVGRKAEWPTWTPPAEMVARDPLARPWANGMPGGPENPLGARALYLYYASGADSLYRLHGTPVASSIGQAVSSGCIRLLNQDIIHLYSLVPVGTKVTVLAI